MPIINIPITTCNNLKINIFGYGKINNERSITTEIKIAFKIVPIPGFCFRGNQNNKTMMLTMKVVKPIE